MLILLLAVVVGVSNFLISFPFIGCKGTTVTASCYYATGKSVYGIGKLTEL